MSVTSLSLHTNFKMATGYVNAGSLLQAQQLHSTYGCTAPFRRSIPVRRRSGRQQNIVSQASTSRRDLFVSTGQLPTRNTIPLYPYKC